MIGEAGPVAATTMDELSSVGMADFGAQSPVSYDARRYVRTATFDFANRPQSMSLPINPDNPGASRIGGALSYSSRGLPEAASVTFDETAYTRVIVDATEYNADGLVTRVRYGDAGGTHDATKSTTEYDSRNRPTRMQTQRDADLPGAPGTLSGVTIVADQTLLWDAASNLTRIEDHRIAREWPAGSRPQTIAVDHDALYRVTNAHFDYTGVSGSDDTATDWRTAMNVTHAADPMRTQPAPMLGQLATRPTTRVRDLNWSYDWLGNMTEWNDDAGQFYERSIGDIRNGYGDGDHRPSALYFSADLSGLASTNRGGYVELDYGEGGNALSMTVHGECGDRLATTCAAPETPYGDPDGGSSSSARSAAAHATCQCKTEQHYQYRWDELNRIAEARRYDRDGTVTSPEWKLAVRQRYRYDSANVRTVKQTLETLTDTNSDGFGDGDGDPQERLTLYVYPGDFERRGLTRDTVANAYVTALAKDGATPAPIAETQYVVGGARVVWKAEGEPGRLNGSVDRDMRVTIGIGDLIGTTGAVLDLQSGELVEASTYYPNGARESYVTNTGGDDQAIAPEPMGFTGKEGDEEVGLTYFGERYLISRIGRWASPDPLQIHAAGGGEVGNSYHYIGGDLLASRDALGLAPIQSEKSPTGWVANVTFPGADGAPQTIWIPVAPPLSLSDHVAAAWRSPACLPARAGLSAVAGFVEGRVARLPGLADASPEAGVVLGVVAAARTGAEDGAIFKLAIEASRAGQPQMAEFHLAQLATRMLDRVPVLPTVERMVHSAQAGDVETAAHQGGGTC